MLPQKTEPNALPEPEPGLPPSLRADLDRLNPDRDLLLGDSSVTMDRRSKIWRAANAELRRVLARLAELLAAHSPLLQVRYEVGQQLKSIRDDLLFNGERRFGARAFRKVVIFIGLDGPGVDAVIRLAEAYTREEIEALRHSKNREGATINLHYVVCLAGAFDRQARQEILDGLLEECWTYRELGEQVEEANREQRQGNPPPGRPYTPPGSLDAVIKQQENAADEFLNRSTKVWRLPAFSLRVQADALRPEQFTQERTERIKAHRDRMLRLAQEAQEYATQAGVLHEDFLRVLKDRQRATGVKEESLEQQE